MVVETAVLQRPQYPFDGDFYDELIAARPSFQLVASQVVPPNRGYGLRVEQGQAFRLTMIEDAQVVDTCILSADEPTERVFPGTQLAIEGFRISRFTRLWGTPPTSRPLATCIANTVRTRPDPSHMMRDHFCHTAYCNSHVHALFGGTSRNPCYDNLREGMAIVGLGQRFIHDNVNLFMKGAIDPSTGAVLLARSDAQRGDYIEFYAETAIFCVLSLCPGGAGADGPPEEGDPELAVHPVQVDVYSTGIDPLGWPYASVGSG